MLDVKQKTVTLPVMECNHCGHRWVARQLEKPKYCPRCKNPLKERADK